MPQLLLFPDPRPLVERLGKTFFQELPELPGIYLMRDTAQAVLYVGKAKNLRKRLNSYRVANPETMARRHLRMLRAADVISFETCADEATALARESELLLSLKPKFNRAGRYRPPPQFLNWRANESELELRLSAEPELDFSVHGPIHGGAKYFHTSLARLLWWALHPKQSLFDLPSGWIHGHVGKRVVIPSVADASRDAAKMIQSLLHGELVAFSEWVHDRTTSAIKESEAAFRDEDLEAISRVLKKLSHDSFRN